MRSFKIKGTCRAHCLDLQRAGVGVFALRRMARAARYQNAGMPHGSAAGKRDEDRALSGRPSADRKGYYPGLESHPQHALAKTQQRGFGAMLSFDTKAGRSIAERVCM